MSEPHETPLQEAISFITIGAILVGVACYIAAQQNLPFASPALFWVASMVYHWVPGLDAIRVAEMPILVGAATIGVSFFIVGIPFAGLLGTWFSSARIADVERQIVKLQRSRSRVQKRRRASDRYDAR